MTASSVNRKSPAELVISREDLAELLEYSMSIPTGATIGKRWRKDVAIGKYGVEPEWMIGEYYELPPGERFDKWGKEQVGIHWSWAVDENHEVHRGKLE